MNLIDTIGGSDNRPQIIQEAIKTLYDLANTTSNGLSLIMYIVDISAVRLNAEDIEAMRSY